MAAERVQNPTSDKRRERIGQRPHQVVQALIRAAHILWRDVRHRRGGNRERSKLAERPQHGRNRKCHPRIGADLERVTNRRDGHAKHQHTGVAHPLKQRDRWNLQQAQNATVNGQQAGIFVRAEPNLRHGDRQAADDLVIRQRVQEHQHHHRHERFVGARATIATPYGELLRLGSL